MGDAREQRSELPTGRLQRRASHFFREFRDDINDAVESVEAVHG